MQAIEDSKVPLAIAEESMIQREKRTGMEQVLDDAERGLSEVTVHDTTITIDLPIKSYKQ